jgi:6-phosphogluconolactonase
MVQQTLIEPLGAQPHVYPVDTAEPADGARAYEQNIRDTVPARQGSGPPAFDLILLGMGADGHTASLFPGTGAVDERARLVTEVYVPKLDAWRISFTYPLINAARNVVVMVSGPEKAATVGAIFGPATDREPLPVEDIQPAGDFEWHLDADAAARLDPVFKQPGAR